MTRSICTWVQGSSRHSQVRDCERITEVHCQKYCASATAIALPRVTCPQLEKKYEDRKGSRGADVGCVRLGKALYYAGRFGNQRFTHVR